MSKIREDLKTIYTSAIKSVNPQTAIENHLKISNNILTLHSNNNEYKKYDLTKYKNIFVVGAGKATAPMALAIEKMLGSQIKKGCICVKYGYTTDLKNIDIIEASHPIPDKNGIVGAKKIMDILQKADENDLVISLISGGGSALLPLPPESITLEDKRTTTDLLLKIGASIHEINSVRKHLSCVKGGNMAKAAYPATVMNLMISDVVGDNMDVIASGPFVPDNSSFSMAMDIFKKYSLIEKLPPSVFNYINMGADGKIEDNPDETDKVFSKITNLIVASNIIALKAAKNEAQKLGYNSIILSSLIEGDTEDVAFWHSRIAQEILLSSNPVPRPACIISGGETTVMIKGDGLGGRSMEFAIHAAKFINGLEKITIAGIGTDGTDGPTDAAGAVADGFTVQNSFNKSLNIDKFIKNNNSYNFFKETGDLIITGPTNTNVMDIRIILVDE